LLFEALHQLHVTQDKQKIEMLGRALANSGAKEFSEESQKELFLQLIRDLTAQHIAMLHELAPPSLKAEPGSSPSPEELWSWDENPTSAARTYGWRKIQDQYCTSRIAERLMPREVSTVTPNSP
jgi:hypothetical protein